MVEKYTPVRELPEEITSMPKEATVCSFCGVSYLIHHEIKRLEEELKESHQRLKVLEAENSNQAKENQHLELSLKVKGEELAMKEECTASMQEELHCLHAKCCELEARCRTLDNCTKEFKTGKLQALKKTQLLSSRVSDLRGSICEMTMTTKEDINDMTAMFSDLTSKLFLYQQHIDREVKTWEHRIFVTKNELSDEIQCCKQSLQSVEETLLETKTEMSSVLSDNKSLKEKLQVSLNALRKQELQIEHIKADGHRQLTAKTVEFERSIQEADKRVLKLNSTLNVLSLSLKEKEKQLHDLQNAYSEKEREMRRCLNNSEKKCKELMEQLSFAEKTHNSKIAKLKLAYDDRTAALHKTIAQNRQEFQDKLSKANAESHSTISKLKASLTVAELEHKRVSESLQEELKREKSIHDQEVNRHLQQVKDLEIRLIKDKDEALSKVLKLEQKLAECDRNYDKLDNKLVEAYKEISTLQALVQKQCEER